MLGADIAQRVLAECEYQPAESVSAQERTAAVIRHNEVRLRLRGDMCAQSMHKVTGSLTQSSLLHVGSDRVDL